MIPEGFAYLIKIPFNISISEYFQDNVADMRKPLSNAQVLDEYFRRNSGFINKCQGIKIFHLWTSNQMNHLNLKLESPPAWTQEAYHLSRGKCMPCCSGGWGRGVPTLVGDYLLWWGGTYPSGGYLPWWGVTYPGGECTYSGGVYLLWWGVYLPWWGGGSTYSGGGLPTLVGDYLLWWGGTFSGGEYLPWLGGYLLWWVVPTLVGGVPTLVGVPTVVGG